MASGMSNDPYDDDHAVLDDDFLNEGARPYRLSMSITDGL